MLITKSKWKTKKFLQKTIKNLTSFFSQSYEKLPKSPPSLNPFTTCSKKQLNDNLCAGDLPMLPKELIIKEQDHAHSEGLEKTSNPPPNNNNKKQELIGGKKQKALMTRGGNYNRVSSSSRDINLLAEKMKELDMMEEVGDTEHALDVEEALHYYSRLRSPVYLDIVDNFFMDMYSEFNAPQRTLSISKSRRRRGSFRF